ncbi:MAG: dephospho-CoA kinase [Desulfovibrio sp.]|nr:dephospho-CoA kinase [Desulfovibrio sp.]
MISLHHVTSIQQAGQRLDRVLRELAPEYSRAALQKAIKNSCCCLDGLPVTSPDLRLHAGQTLELNMPDVPSVLQAEDGDVELLWRDEHLLVCNKPVGLTVHPCPSCPEHTLVQRLLRHIPQLGDMEGLRPGIVHRLDKDTSGLLLVALTEADRQTLASAFAKREIHKEYLALVSGVPAQHGHCREPLGRSPTSRVKMAVVPETHGGRPAHTEWSTLWASPDGRFSLLAVRLHTGRTHQIRVHMAHIGHPLLGDKIYAPKTVQEKAPRQMLHAWHIAFSHPTSDAPMQFHCPPPQDMMKTALDCSRRMQRVVVTGNPGSGKSSLTQALASMGTASISADDVVAQLYAKDGEAAQWIERMNPSLLTPRGHVDKTALLAAMVEDARLRHDVECAVHAMTRQAIERFWEQKEANGIDLAVAEVPLFFEAGWRNAFTPAPVIVGVRCPLATRASRIQAQRSWNKEKAEALESWQWPEERKLAACDVVIDNSGTIKQLDVEAQKLLSLLARKRQEAEDALRDTLTALWGKP